MFLFWQRWLLCVSLGGVLIGLHTAIAGTPDPLGLYDTALNERFWGDSGAISELPQAALAERRFLFAPLGGTLVGFFTLTTILIAIPYRRRQRWAHTTLAAGMLAWFLTDSAMSMAHGAWFNLYLVNVPSIILWTIPLIFTVSEMKSD